MTEDSGSQRYCVNCGTEIRSGIRFCVSCGKPVNGGPASSGPGNPVPPPTPTRSLADTLKKTFQGLTERFSNARSASSGASLSGLPNKAINWFKDLSSVPKLIIVGLVLLFVAVLLSPVIFFVGLALILIGIVAVVINLIRRKPFKKWGFGIGAAVAFTFIIGIVSNFTYNTNYVWGIGYDLSVEERTYVDEVSRIQGGLKSAIYEQEYILDDYLAEAYPYVSDNHGWRAANNLNLSSENRDAAEMLKVPDGCKEHYDTWLEAAGSADFFVYESGAAMYSGREQVVDEHLTYARIGRNDADRYFKESDRMLSRIQRAGCDL